MRPAGSLPSRIAEHVQNLIAAGELGPGDQLPGERELADLLAVSRSSVREAVQSLAALGYLSVQHGHGVFINGSAPAGPPGAQRIDAADLTDGRCIAEFHAMREALEAPAARWAAWNLAPRGVAGVDQAYTRLVAATNVSAAPEEQWRSHDAFHEAIARAAGNRLVLRALQDLNQTMPVYLRVTSRLPDRSRHWAAWHSVILEAIKTGDGRCAERVARAHIRAAHRDARSRSDGEPERMS